MFHGEHSWQLIALEPHIFIAKGKTHRLLLVRRHLKVLQAISLGNGTAIEARPGTIHRLRRNDQGFEIPGCRNENTKGAKHCASCGYGTNSASTARLVGPFVVSLIYEIN
jgi:hypothetical protein